MSKNVLVAAGTNETKSTKIKPKRKEIEKNGKHYIYETIKRNENSKSVESK